MARLEDGLADVLPGDGTAGALGGRVWLPRVDGPAVVAARGGDVLVWDPATGDERQRFPACKGDIAVLAVSPDGTLVVYTTGNENPQLDVITTSGSGQCCNAIYSGIDFPLRPDWQPRP